VVYGSKRAPHRDPLLASHEAEDAYRESLAICVRLENVDGQAGALAQLGNLYDDVLNRSEEAVTLYRQAADMYLKRVDLASEGKTRNNLGHTLGKLRRLDQALQEIGRAIECESQFGQASSLWTSWGILADIETDAGNPAAAASLLQRLAATPRATGPIRTFIHAHQAIVAGSRDRTLANAPDLNFRLAAEILFLLETLEKPR
jgi:tetratricopeptide (TPR) repeat protein